MLLTLVVLSGRLLFDYDIAVANGTEKSLVEFYISKILVLAKGKTLEQMEGLWKNKPQSIPAPGNKHFLAFY